MPFEGLAFLTILNFPWFMTCYTAKSTFRWKLPSRNWSFLCRRTHTVNAWSDSLVINSFGNKRVRKGVKERQGTPGTKSSTLSLSMPIITKEPSSIICSSYRIIFEVFKWNMATYMCMSLSTWAFNLKKKDEDNCRMYVLLRVWID